MCRNIYVPQSHASFLPVTQAVEGEGCEGDQGSRSHIEAELGSETLRSSSGTPGCRYFGLRDSGGCARVEDSVASTANSR